jgi:hypothetical protein
MGRPYEGEPGEEIDPEKIDVYRGGHDLAPKPDEYKIDPESGYVKGTHGVSLETDAAILARFGAVIRVKSVPSTLKIIQRGRRPTQFEIVPRQPMNPWDYEDALDQVELG